MYRTILDVDLSGKRVLLRADLNVPMKAGVMTDLTRLERLVPTFDALRASRVIVLSHLGRPDGKRDAAYSLQPVAEALERILNRRVLFIEDCIGETVAQRLQSLRDGDIAVLENTRFYPEEEANDRAFSQALASLADVFVHDAFSAAHRAHASTEGVGHFLPTYAGLLMAQELDALEKALGHPAHPVIALVGGSKISTKLDLLNNLIDKVDYLILGGGMANTFLAARGVSVGNSLYEKEMLSIAKKIEQKAVAKGCRLVLPTDVVVASACVENARTHVRDQQSIGPEDMVLDIGPQTVQEIARLLETCQTVVWNGPLGVFEVPPFHEGTLGVAHVVARLTQEHRLLSVAGGGDTVAALNKAGIAQALSYLSSAGGAFLEWLEGKKLPGVDILAKIAPCL